MTDNSGKQEAAFKISGGVLQSSELSRDQVQEDLRCLSDILGESLQSITDFNVSGTNELRKLHYLAESVSFFEDNETLKRVIERFESPQEAHSHIPTLFFARYILSESNGIEFEPDRGDILLDWRGELVTLEFKRPRMGEGNEQYWKQHRDKLDAIKSVLDNNFQYSIRYDTEHDFEFLLPLLEAEVGNLNSPGRTRLANTIEVDLQETDGFNEDTPVGSLIIPGSMMDKDTGDWLPVTHYAGAEATFSIAGPKIDETEKVADLINGARKQLTKDTPNIVVIYIGNMMDSISNLKRKTQNLFKKSSNTRINAVVLWDYHFTTSGEIQVTSRTVQNPYAANSHPTKFFDSLSNLDEKVVTD